MYHFDVCNSTKLERLKLESGVSRCSLILHRCYGPPCNLSIKKKSVYTVTENTTTYVEAATNPTNAAPKLLMKELTNGFFCGPKSKTHVLSRT